LSSGLASAMETARLADSDIEASAQHRQSAGVVRKAVGAAAAVGLFCAGGWAGEHFASRGPTIASSEEAQQFTQIIAKPKRGVCSSTKEDCMATGCCSTVGYNCFTTTKGSARCLKSCTPSATRSCTQPQNIMDPILQDATFQSTSLYCFSAYTQNTGTTKKNFELEILQMQYSQNIGVFACDQAEVFSDVEADLGPGAKTIVVHDTEGDFHFAKRKTSGAWVNTGMFTKIWKAIEASGKFRSADWVAKVDADAVFVPSRLVRWLQGQRVPETGIYLENCKFVKYGYFGNLEVFSKAAFNTLLANMDACKADPQINWKVGVEGGKYGPMGEDLFAQACLDQKNVRRVEAFDITTDGACPADRPKDEKNNKKWKPNCAWVSTPAMHPFKKLDEWVKCHEATVAAFGK